MGKEKIQEMLNLAREKDKSEYYKAQEILSFLNAERIKFVGNGLRNALGRTAKSIDKEKIQSCVKELNRIAKEVGSDLRIPEEMEGIEKYLRYTILEDIQSEFEGQKM